MPRLTSLETRAYRIPLPGALSNSTHGTINHFELITARVRDGDGAEGVGYTYTVDANGLAVHAVVDRYLRRVVEGEDAQRIEALWQKMCVAREQGARPLLRKKTHGAVQDRVSAIRFDSALIPGLFAGARIPACVNCRNLALCQPQGLHSAAGLGYQIR